MRILIASHRFAPSIGGIEQVSATLAETFAELGHEVCVVTQTGAPDTGGTSPYPVWRRPGPGRLLALTRRCDVYFQNNISLATLWPAWLLGRPVVVTYQTWVTQPDGSEGWREKMKVWCARRTRENIAISRAIAASLLAPSRVIPNPYRDDSFFADATVPRTRELVFVGRLVSDKGVDLLIDALSRLHTCRLTPALTIVGSGPEEAALREQATRAGVAGAVRFLGPLTGTRLRQELNAHEIMVVPSRRAEPFGVVALEGAACGCVVVGSAAGGLPDAIGPAGEVFPQGDVAALSEVLERLLGEPDRRAALRAQAAAHLDRHRRRPIASAYLEVFRRSLGK
ncbi:MAG TPA: glycosyltransferase family 4 protein [Opitutus sp.]|nr:glycosyltransferase family 4 protein [Opitutus sp.]